MNAAITTEVDKISDIKKKLSNFPSMNGLELASKVSTKEPYEIGNKQSKKRLAVIDLGIKKIYLIILLIEIYILKFFHLTQILMKC